MDKISLLLLAALSAPLAHAETWTVTSAQARLISTSTGGTASLYNLLETAGFARSRTRDGAIRLEAKGITITSRSAANQVNTYEAALSLGEASKGRLEQSPTDANQMRLILTGEISNLLFDVVAKHGQLDALFKERGKIVPKYVSYHFESVRCSMSRRTTCVVALNKVDPK